jgi:penicillin-insensitive murein endopeptidase
MRKLVSLFLLAAMAMPILTFANESTCFGKVNSGHLEDGVQLPISGNNFSAYSNLGVSLGRTYVHSDVRDVVVRSYQSLELSAPSKTFVYGETGWKRGGRFRPHRTHQNGLSVDFMVPVVDKSGRSVALPTSALNKFGYGLEFDGQGKFGDLQIDFEAMAEHLYQITEIAKQDNVGISLVIFDHRLRPLLFKTKRGAYLQQTLPWMKGNAWVRHDQHYHIDFSISCHPAISQMQ